MDRILKGLNEQQKEAVCYERGPLLIIAGAGTGKTAVVTRRIAWLVSQGLAKQDEILALTFTDKAAAEMQERVDLLVPYGWTDIWVSTFHAFGDKLLRENALRLGLNSDFKVLSRCEAAVFFRENLFSFDLSYYRPLGDPTKFLQAIVAYYSRLKDEDISPQEYLAYAHKLAQEAERGTDEALKEEAARHSELARVFDQYQRLLLRAGMMDFGNQFYLALRLLRNHPAALGKYQRQFKYILVDEFQDTNFAQFELIKLLAAGHKNITVVADDDQCLPPGSLVDTLEGAKKIEEIKKGDDVLTAVGKGHIGVSRVRRVFRKRRKVRLLTFQTQSGHKVTVTSEHKMFCFVPVRTTSNTGKYHYVYLMWRNGLGWRLGITDNLAVRLKIERSADKIVGLRAFEKEQDAQYFEVYLSLKYGIPTVCFMSRKGVFIAKDLLNRLYRELDTDVGVNRLARDLDIDLRFHHYCLDAVTRGDKVRIKANLHLCSRKYIARGRRDVILKRPYVLHRVTLQTSHKGTITRLRSAGIRLVKQKKGGMGLSYSFQDIKEAESFIRKIEVLTGAIVEYKFNLARLKVKNLPALLMPASNVLPGHYLPVRKGCGIVYDKIVSLQQRITIETVYDLEIERTHNFIVQGIIVHNCIFRFRGAAYSNILNFMREYPDAGRTCLIQNYRSAQSILDSAYRLICHNNPERFEVKSGIDKRLVSRGRKGPGIKYRAFDTLSSEADYVAAEIERRMKKGGRAYSDFAILVRSNKDADPFLRSLNMRNIPWRFSGNQGLYAREEVRVCISFLKIMADSEDSLSVFHLLSSDVYGMDVSHLSPLMHYARRRHISLFSVLRDKTDDPCFDCLGQGARKKIGRFVGDMGNYLKQSRRVSTGRLLYLFLMGSGYIAGLTNAPTLENEEKICNIARFFDIVRSYENLSRQDRVFYFIDHLNLLIEAGDDPAVATTDLDLPAVQVLTIHKSKGLEFDIVFMVSLVQGRFPWPRRSEALEVPAALIKGVLPAGDFHIQEERHLFYVGMTRARRELIFTAAKDYGGSRLRRPSRFIAEALGEEANALSAVKSSSALEAIKRNAPPADSAAAKKGRFPPRALSAEGILNLSYYQIDDYLTCPLKYKYIHILRVPIMDNHTVIYGKAMHEAVLAYYRVKKQGGVVSEADVLAAFDNAFSAEGFLSGEHIQRRRRAAYAGLRRFFLAEQQRGRLPAYVEKEFSFVLGNNRINGRWDRLDITDGRAVIVDFKTSEVKKQKDADKKAKDNLQLTIYALAYQAINGALPEAVQLYF
ncbi:MAG: UvrD-helicase domain-containing protein, partial [Candidatus Omnitrophota bacterium]